MWAGSVRWPGSGHGKHVILDFAAKDSYYEYIAYFYPPDVAINVSLGTFLSGGYRHIVLAPSPRVQDTLVHELSHNRLAHLPLPRWLDEGIAVTMERKLSGNKGGMLDRELHRDHRAFWTPESIGAFWSGDSFHADEGDGRALSYSLAEVLVDLLVQDFPNFMDFVAKADDRDAGQSAAVEVLGLSLGDVVATFLGPGDWAAAIPAPEARGNPPSRA
ncbi:MAG: hypothetical protein WDO13_18025 [Verrucomicrobiota bacterium]